MYKKEDKIIESIHKLVEGARGHDFSELDAFFAEGAEGRLLAERLTDDTRREAIEQKLRAKDFKKAYNRLYDELNTQNKGKSHKQLKRVSALVAGVAAVLVATFFLLQQELGVISPIIDKTLAESKEMDVVVPTLITEEGVYSLDGNFGDIKRQRLLPRIRSQVRNKKFHTDGSVAKMHRPDKSEDATLLIDNKHHTEWFKEQHVDPPQQRRGRKM